MATINYRFSDDRFEEIEVSDEVKAAYEEMESDERKRRWREHKRGEVSIEWCMKRRIEIADPINRDPAEMFFERKGVNFSSLVTLTDYQSRVAEMRFVERKTERQIAVELGKSQQSVNEILRKISKKMARFLA